MKNWIENNKKFTFCILISVVVLAVVITCGVCVIGLQKDRPNTSNATQENVQENLDKDKEQAMKEIKEVYDALDPEEQEECEKLISQYEEKINNAADTDSVQSLLKSALMDIQNQAGKAKKENENQPKEANADHSEVLDIILHQDSKWDSMTDEEKAEAKAQAMIIHDDENGTLANMYKNTQFGDGQHRLTQNLKEFCNESNIDATEAEYLAYGEYISRGRSITETFYLQLNDKNKTILYVMHLPSEKFDGKNVITSEFEISSKTREEIFNGFSEDDFTDPESPLEE